MPKRSKRAWLSHAFNVVQLSSVSGFLVWLAFCQVFWRINVLITILRRGERKDFRWNCKTEGFSIEFTCIVCLRLFSFTTVTQARIQEFGLGAPPWILGPSWIRACDSCTILSYLSVAVRCSSRDVSPTTRPRHRRSPPPPTTEPRRAPRVVPDGQTESADRPVPTSTTDDERRDRGRCRPETRCRRGRRGRWPRWSCYRRSRDVVERSWWLSYRSTPAEHTRRTVDCRCCCVEETSRSNRRQKPGLTAWYWWCLEVTSFLRRQTDTSRSLNSGTSDTRIRIIITY